FSSRRRHTRSYGDWSSDVCSSDLPDLFAKAAPVNGAEAAGSWLGPGTAPVPYSGTADETPTITLGMLDSFRNIPVLMWNTGEDRSEERRVGKEGGCRGSASQ